MDSTKAHPANLNSPAVASELNNLLQIIAGTAAHLESSYADNPGAGDYFAMLRSSIARAAEVTSHLVEQSHTLEDKVILHPNFNPPARTASPTRASSATSKRIMVVDDEKMLLVLTREILSEAGYEVVTAQSGFECLELFRWNPLQFDLILLDLNMPLMDGEETFQRLRALRPDVRVMLCTGYVQQERLNHMLEEGLAGFVQKPLGPQQYLASVRKVLAAATLGQPTLAS